ncbi:Pentatricopeptide repeat-containing protein [Melia azedarach]|uniref:Pentatricopeptide repeat-containing protein n=1 Tax=Melia azedarach TaxID=155640 RepID=A0ACC1Y6T8_MELAZ|nr:Pentatricopeptide repeat-containing protein [Melia azedarach]
MSTTTSKTLPWHLKPEEISAKNIHTSQLSQKNILKLLNTKCSTSWQHLKQAHAVILKSGQFQDHYVSGTLVKCYANIRFGNLDLALNVFFSVPSPNVFVWNTVLRGCLEHNEPWKVIRLYYKMVAGDSRPNKFTYPTVFKACTISEADKEGMQVHAHVVKNGLCGDVHIKSSGIQMYASFGCVTEASRILDDGGDLDVICWNAMIDGYLKCGEIEAAKELFKSMSGRNIGSYNAMISGLARFGMFQEARKLFDDMSDKDEISWSAMIDGYIKGGCHKEALEVFNEMQRENNIRPRQFVISSVLSACANLGAFDQGRWIHAYVKKNSMYLDAVLGTALIDMYAKCARLDMAWEVFENMKVKEVFSWNAMIGGLAMHGRAEDAIELFFKMQSEKMRPDGITFLCILKACAHAGMVEEGVSALNDMKKMYNIEPEIEHYGCVVDLLGRAGFLAEAEEVINSMPMEPNAAVWGALLGACRKHGNVELGERVGKILLEMEPENSGRYAVLSNIYAKEGRWEDVAEVRKLMKERGIKTNPGTSMIDLNGVVHEFKIGDGSHPQVEEIYLMLESIVEKLKMEGYSPKSSQVLFDVDEVEKETAVKYHSEKLAIAFGFINTDPGTTIRIVKNLRVCEDCHSATKLISKVYKRDIIVRDRVRFHHFRNVDDPEGFP